MLSTEEVHNYKITMIEYIVLFKNFIDVSNPIISLPRFVQISKR